MRNNQPVSQQEYEVADGITLVSTTDLESRITYCNPAFIEVSGYAKSELIGQPHNLVRHPDMPAEAFRDMWHTLRSGHPWSAMVKNRRKNGDHYWVVANVTPLMQDGQPVGYMSVRTKPSRQQVQQAEALYARMRSEAAAGGAIRTQLQQGVLRARGLARVALFLRQLAQLGEGALAGAIAAALAAWLFGPGMAAVLAGAVVGASATAFSRWRLLARARLLIPGANRLAAGDLGQAIDIEQAGEFVALAKALNQVSVNMQAIVADVRHEVAGVSAASSEIASGNANLSARTEQTAANLQQTAASMEQITGTVKSSADTAQQATELAASASAAASDGGAVMARVVQTMGTISAASKKIADIIGTIDGIAFQTNILALNAAVEAARAGEQGRGFAVVASEVRSLAQRSAQAAKEIKLLIGDSVDKVEDGTRLVGSAGETVQRIVTQVKRVSDLIGEISSATHEQTVGIGQVGDAVANLDEMTQQNAALVEQSAAAAESLRGQALHLSEVVSIFKLGRRG
jgi:aerotaxis receptor